MQWLNNESYQPSLNENYERIVKEFTYPWEDGSWIKTDYTIERMDYAETPIHAPIGLEYIAWSDQFGNEKSNWRNAFNPSRGSAILWEERSSPW